MKEMIEDLKEYFTNHPFVNMTDLDEINHPVYTPIRFVDKEKFVYSPIVYYDEEDKEIDYRIPEEIDFSYYLKKIKGL